jgi:hypothetical protein
MLNQRAKARWRFDLKPSRFGGADFDIRMLASNR